PTPLHRPTTCAPARSPSAAVLARSSGHCEVCTDRCRYTYDRLISRCPSQPNIEDPSPAALFAACTVCAEIVASLDVHLATQLGHMADAGHDPGGVPFHGRWARWVMRDRDGWLTELRQQARTA